MRDIEASNVWDGDIVWGEELMKIPLSGMSDNG